jgi:hypothetical protein
MYHLDRNHRPLPHGPGTRHTFDILTPLVMGFSQARARPNDPFKRVTLRVMEPANPPFPWSACMDTGFLNRVSEVRFWTFSGGLVHKPVEEGQVAAA